VVHGFIVRREGTDIELEHGVIRAADVRGMIGRVSVVECVPIAKTLTIVVVFVCVEHWDVFVVRCMDIKGNLGWYPLVFPWHYLSSLVGYDTEAAFDFGDGGSVGVDVLKDKLAVEACASRTWAFFVRHYDVETCFVCAGVFMFEAALSYVVKVGDECVVLCG
jgi:hypothetical protein